MSETEQNGAIRNTEQYGAKRSNSEHGAITLLVSWTGSM